MFIACAAGLVATLLLSRWSYYRQEDDDEPGRIFEAGKGSDGEARGMAGGLAERTRDAQAESSRAGMSLPVAFAPYAFLGVVATITLALPPVRSALETFSVGLPFPATETGYAVREEAVDAYAAFAPLTHPGTFLLFSALVGYLLFSLRGRYPAHTSVLAILKSAAADALPVTTAVAGLLLTSKVMGHAGEVTVLALGVTNVTGSMLYLASANQIGILGSLVTSSNTASNVLFAPLQATAAQAEGVSVPLALGAQAAGGATGNAIAPSDALLGATAVGDPGLVGAVLRRAIPWALIAGVLTSLATLGLAVTLGGGG
jgi:lactate permease